MGTLLPAPILGSSRPWTQPQPRRAHHQPLLSAGELVASRPLARPSGMGRTVRDAKRFVADVDRTLVARQTVRRGELSGVCGGEVGVEPLHSTAAFGSHVHNVGATFALTPDRAIAHATIRPQARRPRQQIRRQFTKVPKYRGSGVWEP